MTAATDMIHFVEEEMRLQRMPITRVSRLSGHSHRLVINWINKTRSPTVPAMQDVLNVLGYSIAIVDKHTLEVVYPEKGVPEE